MLTTAIMPIAGLTLLALWVHILWRNARAVAGIPPLQARNPDGPLPKLSVIVAARNEEAAIADCLARLQRQTHPGLEIIAVNDRSTDRTGELIDQAAKQVQPGTGLHPVVPVHLSQADLPEGWLGKCNALSRGAAAASGQWLLFLDGDVLLEDETLERALAHAQSKDADMICILPDMVPGDSLEQSLMLVFSLAFLYKFHPTHAMDPGRPEYMGVGAFNMVSRRAYDAIGGHEKLRLMIIDDVALGGLVKRAGFRLAVAGGGPAVRVRWYSTVWSMVCGLEKNAFAGVGYSVAGATAACAAMAALYCGPLLLALATPWPWNLPAWVNLLLFPAIGVAAGRRQSFGGLMPGLLLPVGGLLAVATMARSTLLTIWRGGVVWRDSFYPLSQLREFTLPR